MRIRIVTVGALPPAQFPRSHMIRAPINRSL
jgi:hypothetical protein